MIIVVKYYTDHHCFELFCQFYDGFYIFELFGQFHLLIIVVTLSPDDHCCEILS